MNSFKLIENDPPKSLRVNFEAFRNLKKEEINKVRSNEIELENKSLINKIFNIM